MEAIYSSLIVTVAAILIIHGVDANACPHYVTQVERGYTAVHNHVCYLFVNEEVYWKSARDKCWDLGGEMIAIENQETMEFIKKKLNSKELSWDRQGVWLGAKYTHGRWRWTNGRTMEYSNWASGEPSKLLGFLSVEDCSQMRQDDDWQWHDYPCGALKFHYNYICQFPAIEPTTTTITTATSTPTSTTSASSSTQPPAVSSQIGLSRTSLDLSYEDYKRLEENIFQRIYNRGSPDNYHFHSNLNNAALNKPGDKTGRVASSASNQEEDNGNSSILAIIIGVSAGLLLIMLIIFLLLHIHHRQAKRKANEATVHYTNNGYHNTNNPNSTAAGPAYPDHQLPPVPASRPPMPANDGLYLTPKEVTGIYTEVNKPRNYLHTVNFPSKGCNCTRAQTGASNSVCSSPGTSSELGACGGSDPEQEVQTPLMTASEKTSGVLLGAAAAEGSKCCNCSPSQGEYIDMNSLVMKEEKDKCGKKDEEKHTYSNVDHRDSGIENHYEVLP